MSVAVDGAFGYFEFTFDDPDVAPLEEGFFEGVAVGVVADGAESLVAPEVNFILGFGLGLWARGGGAGSGLFERLDWAGFSFGAPSCGGFCTFGLYCGLSVNVRSGSLTFRRRIRSGVNGFRVKWFRVNGNHDGVASLFEGFDGGFEGGETVEEIGSVGLGVSGCVICRRRSGEAGLRGRRGDQGRNPWMLCALWHG